MATAAPDITPDSIVYLNGSWTAAGKAQISVFDRGFLFGEGAYEVMLATHGRVPLLDRNEQRLTNSLRALDIPTPHIDWPSLIATLLSRNGISHGLIYAQVTRGAVCGRTFGYNNSLFTPTVFVCAWPYVSPEADQLLRATRIPDPRWQHCFIKSTALVAAVMAKHAAKQRGFDEVIFSRDGYLTEGGSCNIFVIKDGTVTTPPLSEHILAGTIREAVLGVVREAGLTAVEAPLPISALDEADEVWTTSTSRHICAVTTVDSHTIGNGRDYPCYRRIRALLRERLYQPPSS